MKLPQLPVGHLVMRVTSFYRRFCLLLACNATDIFNNNWRQAEVRILLLAGAIAANALAQGALRGSGKRFLRL